MRADFLMRLLVLWYDFRDITFNILILFLDRRTFVTLFFRLIVGVHFFSRPFLKIIYYYYFNPSFLITSLFLFF